MLRDTRTNGPVRSATAVAVVVIALTATLAGCGEDAEPVGRAAPVTTTATPTTSTTTEPTTTTTQEPTTTTTTEPMVALETMESAATTIVGLLNAQDVPGLLEYLETAALSTSIGVYGGPESDSVDALVRALGFHTAVGTKWTIDECEPTGSSGRLACVVPAVVPLHQALGLSEVASDMRLHVADDGSVSRFAWRFVPVANEEFLSHWVLGIQPFYDWMEQNHPDDLDAMLTDAHGVPQSDEAALKLWAAHTAEYVASLAG